MEMTKNPHANHSTSIILYAGDPVGISGRINLLLLPS